MDAKGAKILLVDDEDEIRKLMALKLEASGYEVRQAKDGAEAFAAAQEMIPDLIVADIVMPVMDGGQLLKKLRSTYFGKEIPFVVITARANMRDYFESAQVDDFITKPFLPGDFIRKVELVLGRHRQEGPALLTKRVLIVGGNSACVNVMMEALNKEGCHVDCVPWSEQVISKAVMFLPNILITEAQMPGIPMEQNIRILRQMPQFRKLPILLYTAISEPSLPKGGDPQQEVYLMMAVKHCLEEGATEYIGSFQKDTFMSRVGKYLKKAEIVVIDDDPTLTQLLQGQLGKEGYKVEVALTGEKGLELIKQEHPHLVLLDVILPGMVGYEVLGKIKDDPAIKDIPVIMMTVKGENNAIQKALDLGADDYIVKPFHMGLLKKRIQSWVDGFPK